MSREVHYVHTMSHTDPTNRSQNINMTSAPSHSPTSAQTSGAHQDSTANFEATKRSRDFKAIDAPPGTSPSSVSSSFSTSQGEVAIKRTRWEAPVTRVDSATASAAHLQKPSGPVAWATTPDRTGGIDTHPRMIENTTSSMDASGQNQPTGPIIASLLTGLQIDLTQPPYCHYARLWLKEHAHLVVPAGPAPALAHTQSGQSVDFGDLPLQAPQLMASGSSLGALPGISLVSATATLPTATSSLTSALPSLSRAQSLQRAPSLAPSLSQPPVLASQLSQSSTLSHIASSPTATNTGSTQTSLVDSCSALEQSIKLQASVKMAEYTLNIVDEYVDTLKQRLEELSQRNFSGSTTSTQGESMPMLTRAVSVQSAPMVIGTVPSTSILADYFVNRFQ